MATVISIKRHGISGSFSYLSSWNLSVISGLACFAGGIAGLVIIAVFLFPFVLIIAFFLKFVGL